MDTRTFDTRTLRIRELNDALRANFLRSVEPNGKIFLTRALAGLIQEDQAFWEALDTSIRSFDDFTDDNDPYGEHDMAFFEYNGESMFWKIDYYDLTFSYHSPDAADPSVTCRVLTVGLAEDY